MRLLGPLVLSILLLACADAPLPILVDSAPDALVQDALVQDALVEDALVEDAPVPDALVQDAAVPDTLLEDAPVDDTLSADGGLDSVSHPGDLATVIDTTTPPVVEMLFGSPMPPETCTAAAVEVDVSAPTFVVGNGTPQSCTEAALRAAVTAGGTITFSCGAKSHTIALGATLAVGKDTVVDGGGTVTLSGGNTVRVFTMDQGNWAGTTPVLTVQNLRLVAGRAPTDQVLIRPWLDPAAACTPNTPGPDIHFMGSGGAIFHQGGTVRVIRSVIENSTAAVVGPDVAGGAIYGLGGYAQTIVERSIIRGNRASNGGAVGGLFSAITISNSHLLDNHAEGCGANYEEPNPNGPGTLQHGSGGSGGAIYLDGAGRELRVCGSRLEDNRGNALGGAIFRVGYAQIFDPQVGDPVPNGISELTLIDRTNIARNVLADREDYGIASAAAGGLYLMGNRVVVSDSSISDNQARIFGGNFIADHEPFAIGELDFVNVTISGNSTYARPTWSDRGAGGGLVVWGDQISGKLLNCTIVHNEAQFGSAIWGITKLDLRNSIIANSGDNSWSPLNCTAPDPLAASYVPGTGGNNLQWVFDAASHSSQPFDPDCAGTTLRADPMLGPLTHHSGVAATLAPAAKSLAAGAGVNCPPNDARGNPRPVTGCTLGAHELGN